MHMVAGAQNKTLSQILHFQQQLEIKWELAKHKKYNRFVSVIQCNGGYSFKVLRNISFLPLLSPDDL